MQQPSPPIAQPQVLPPHTPLPDYYGDEAEHERFLRRIFDDTAPDYDRIERVLALGSGPWYRRAGAAARRARGRRRKCSTSASAPAWSRARR